MTVVKRAIIWAIVILGMAAAKRFGLIDAKAGETLLLVLPVVAVITMFRKGPECGAERRA